MSTDIKNVPERTISVSTGVQSIKDVLNFVSEILAESGCDKKQSCRVNVAVDELYGNVCKYAYKEGEGTATVSGKVDNNTITIKIVDCGKPFNPLELPEPDVTLSAEDRPIGGLGILIVKKIMDYVNYERKTNRNILIVKKSLS